jgi:hypothetical protein
VTAAEEDLGEVDEFADAYWESVDSRVGEIVSNATTLDRVKAVIYRSSLTLSALGAGWNMLRGSDSSSVPERIQHLPEEVRPYYYMCRSEEDYERVTDYVVQDYANRQLEHEMSGFMSVPVSIATFMLDPGYKPLVAVAGTAAAGVAAIGAVVSAPVWGTAAAAAAVGGGVFMALDSAVRTVLQPSKKIAEIPADVAAGAAMGVAIKAIHGGVSSYKARRNRKTNAEFAAAVGRGRELSEAEKITEALKDVETSDYMAKPLEKGSYKIANYDRFRYFRFLLTNSGTGTPVAQGMLSRYKTLNEATYMYLNSSLPIESPAGSYSSVSGLMSTLKGKIHSIDMETLAHYEQYLKSGGLDLRTFNEEVYGAILEGGESGNAHVRAAARMYVKELSEAVEFAQSKGIDLMGVNHDRIDAYYLNAEELKLMKEGLFSKLRIDRGKADVSYWMRHYDIYEVERNYAAFVDLIKQSELKSFIVNSLERVDDVHAVKLEKLKTNYEGRKELFSGDAKKLSTLENEYVKRVLDAEARRKQSIEKILTKFSDEKLNKIAEEKVKAILYSGLNDGVGVEFVDRGLRMKKPRTVLVDDRLLMPYLIKDPRRILKKTMNQLYFRAYEKEVLDKFGYEDHASLVKAIDDEHAEMIKGITDEKQLVKANNEFASAKALLLDLPRLVRNSGAPSIQLQPRVQMAIDFLRKWNYSRLLGEVTLSSFDDIGNIVDAFGTTETLGTALREIGYLVTNSLIVKGGAAVGVERLGNIGDSMSGIWRRLGVAMEGAASEAMSRFDNSYIDVHELTPWISPQERKLWEAAHWTADRAARLTNRLSGIEMWTDFWKSVNGQMYIDKACRIILKENPTKEELNYLAKYRIPTDPVYLDAMRKQIAEHGEVFDGLLNPNLDRWSNRTLSDIFGASIVANANSTVLTPISGDVPVWFNNLFGRLFIQFKHVTFSMLNNITLRYVSGDGGHYVQAFAWYYAANCLSKYIKSITANNPYDLNKPDLYQDAAINLPILSYLGDAAKTLVDIYRYSKQRGLPMGAFEAFSRLSPNLSLVTTVTKSLFRAAKEKPFSEYELRGLYFTFPLAMIPYIKAISTRAIESYVSLSGGKKMRRRREQ